MEENMLPEMQPTQPQASQAGGPAGSGTAIAGKQANEEILTEPKKHGGKKWIFLGIIVIILGILGVVGGYWFWQNYEFEKKMPLPTATASPTPSPTPEATTLPEPTESWKTYENSQYGFMVKYPDTWFTETCNLQSTIYMSPVAEIECTNSTSFAISFTVTDAYSTKQQVVNAFTPNYSYKVFNENLPHGATQYQVDRVVPGTGLAHFFRIIVPLTNAVFFVDASSSTYAPVAVQMMETFEFVR